MDLQNINMKPVPAELKRALAVRGVAAVATIGGLALLAPVIWSAVIGGAGLIVGGVVALVAIGLFQAIPLLAQKAENRILEARKAEARARPLEQLQNYYIGEREKAQASSTNIAEFGARIKTMQDLIVERKRARPNYDSTDKEAEIQMLRTAHAQMVNAYNAAQVALNELAETIDDLSFDDKLSDAGEKAIRSMSSNSGEAALNKILTAESVDTVRNRYNKVFAALEITTAQINVAPSIPHSDGVTIDMAPAKATVTQNREA